MSLRDTKIKFSSIELSLCAFLRKTILMMACLPSVASATHWSGLPDYYFNNWDDAARACTAWKVTNNCSGGGYVSGPSWGMSSNAGANGYEAFFWWPQALCSYNQKWVSPGVCQDQYALGLGEKNIGAPRLCAGNPCDVATGNKYQVETDIPANGVLPPLVRYYNSQLTKDFNTGLGWTWDANAHFENITTTSLLARRPDGRGVIFQKINGAWQTDADIGISLTQETPGYVLRLRDGSLERYSSVGVLVSMTTSQGLTTTITAGSSSGTTDVIGPFGHKLTYTIGANSDIATITTSVNNEVISYSYDAYKNLAQVKYPDNTAKIYHYGNNLFPTALTGISYATVNTDGSLSNIIRYATYGYDTTGKAISTEHAVTTNGASQEKFTLAYDSNTQTTVTDPAGMNEAMTFAVNLGTKNLISKVNQSDSKSVTQTFDNNNNLTCKKDEANHVTLYSYNGTNQKISMTEGLAGTDCNACLTNPTSCNVGGTGRVTTYDYVSYTLDLPRFIRRPSVASGQTFETELVYGDTSHPNLVTQVIQRGFTSLGASVSRSVSLAYNSNGQVSSINGPRTDVNDVTTLSYYNCNTGGACGQLQSVTNALGHVTNFTSYDANGRLLSMTDPNGLVTSYTYDPRGRVKTITQTPTSGSGALTQYSYTAWGDVSQVIDPDGVVLSYGYDEAHYLRTISDAAGNQVRYTYDVKGNRITDYTYDPSGALMRSVGYAYDLRNHLSQVRFPGNASTITAMVNDAVGNPTSETDPNTNNTSHHYDALNRLMDSVNALSQSSVYGYDVNDRPVSVTAANNLTTTYRHDDLGNLLQEVSRDRGTTNYAYDAAGNVLTITNALGQVVTYTYDALNRVTKKQSSVSGTPTYNYYYDGCGAIGPLCNVSLNGNGYLIFSYDGLGRKTYQLDLSALFYSVYVYTPGGRLTQINYPNDRVVDYRYDFQNTGSPKAGNVIQVSTTSADGVTTVLASNLTYKPFGPLASFTFGNNLYYSINFDQAYRATFQSNGPRIKNAFYDAVGNMTGLYDVNNTSQTFTYSSLNELTGATNTQTPGYGSLSYLYNANGNRGSETRNGVTNTYTYANNRNWLMDNQAQYWLYDAAGNAYWSNDAYVMGYDGYGRMVSARSGAALYEYNAFDQRTKKSFGGVTNFFHYGPNGELLYESGGGNKAYVYLNGMLLARVEGNAVYYYHNDQLGAPQAMTDGNGVVVWRALYEPFGSVAITTSTITNNVRFAGMYCDQETSLCIAGARYYDPKSGRWITADRMSVVEHVQRYRASMGVPGRPPLEINPYAYVANNPLRWIDPTGMKAICFPGMKCWSDTPAPLPKTPKDPESGAPGKPDEGPQGDECSKQPILEQCEACCARRNRFNPNNITPCIINSCTDPRGITQNDPPKMCGGSS